METATTLAIIATVISVISLSLSIYEFYLRRKERKPQLQVIAELVSNHSTDSDQPTRYIQAHLLNIGDKPIYITGLTLEATTSKGKTKYPNNFVDSNFGSIPASARSIVPGRIAVSQTFAAGKRLERIHLGETFPLKIEPSEATKLTHILSSSEEDLISRWVANHTSRRTTPLYGVITAYDGTLYRYQSNTITLRPNRI